MKLEGCLNFREFYEVYFDYWMRFGLSQADILKAHQLYQSGELTDHKGNLAILLHKAESLHHKKRYELLQEALAL